MYVYISILFAIWLCVMFYRKLWNNATVMNAQKNWQPTASSERWSRRVFSTTGGVDTELEFLKQEVLGDPGRLGWDAGGVCPGPEFKFMTAEADPEQQALTFIFRSRAARVRVIYRKIS